MASNQDLRIAVFPGDGIGVEVTDACREVLAAVQRLVPGLKLTETEVEAGAFAYQRTGEAFSDEAKRAAEEADAILLGAMGWPDIRYPDGTEIAPQLTMRFELELFAGVRPIRTLPHMPCALTAPEAAQIDLVLIREQTEGLFASSGKGVLENDSVARDTMVITRDGTRRVSEYSFDLARRRQERGRPGKVTCVDKSNVFVSMAFFRQVFGEVARERPDLQGDYCYIDAMAYNLVRRPWNYDVIVTENMFGDILSDLCAALVGGMGMAPSADVGHEHAVFQPAHGSAPDIAGTGKANPTAMIQSAAMMLDWLGERHDHEPCRTASEKLDAAVEAAYADGSLLPYELGGRSGTADVTRKVIEMLSSV